MTPGKTFKLSKRNKTMAALFNFKDQDQRDSFRRMMIQAQLAGEVRPAREKTERKQVHRLAVNRHVDIVKTTGSIPVGPTNL